MQEYRLLGHSLADTVRFDQQNAAASLVSSAGFHMSSLQPDPVPTRTIARRRVGPIVLGTLLGLLGMVAVLTVVVFWSREKLPILTQADYDAALARWDRNKPSDYDLDLELHGNRAGQIHVEVRGGEVMHMTRDGVEPRQKRTWDYWSVPGQLDTIGQELEMSKTPAISFGAPGAAQVMMWAEFDAKYGYPRHYRRVVLGADFEVDWIVTRFDVLGRKN